MSAQGRKKLPARVLAVSNQKGGVGKTTTAINLGTALAAIGEKVLIVDMDPQGNASSGLGVDIKKLERGIYEVLVGSATITEVIQRPQVDGLHIAPATLNLAGANVEFVNLPKREFRLHDALTGHVEEFSYVIIDCPPSLGLLTLNSIVASSEVLIPVQTEYYALEGLSQLLETITMIRENLKPEIDILGAVMTMYDDQYRLSGAVFHELHKFFPHKVFRTIVPRNVRLAEAPSHGKPIIRYDPRSPGASAYRRLAKEVHHSKKK